MTRAPDHRCSFEDCDEPVMARVSYLTAMADKPVQIIVRPPVDRPTGELVCIHHAHLWVDWMLMRSAQEASR